MSLNLAFAAAKPDLRARYEQQIRAAKRSSEPRTRAYAALDTARELQTAWSRSSVAARNLMLNDVATLLLPPGDPQAGFGDDWNYAAMDRLRQQVARLRSQSGAVEAPDAANEALALLSLLAERAAMDTYPSYSAFAAAQGGFDARADGGQDDDIALQRYDAWLRRYRPYLVLAVPLDDPQRTEVAEQMIVERIRFYLDKSPDNSLRGRFEDRLWTYVYDVRYHAGAGAVLAA